MAFLLPLHLFDLFDLLHGRGKVCGGIEWIHVAKSNKVHVYEGNADGLVKHNLLGY